LFCFQMIVCANYVEIARQPFPAEFEYLRLNHYPAVEKESSLFYVTEATAVSGQGNERAVAHISLNNSFLYDSPVASTKFKNHLTFLQQFGVKRVQSHWAQTDLKRFLRFCSSIFDSEVIRHKANPVLEELCISLSLRSVNVICRPVESYLASVNPPDLGKAACQVHSGHRRCTLNHALILLDEISEIWERCCILNFDQHIKCHDDNCQFTVSRQNDKAYLYRTFLPCVDRICLSRCNLALARNWNLFRFGKCHGCNKLS